MDETRNPVSRCSFPDLTREGISPKAKFSTENFTLLVKTTCYRMVATKAHDLMLQPLPLTGFGWTTQQGKVMNFRPTYSWARLPEPKYLQHPLLHAQSIKSC